MPHYTEHNNFTEAFIGFSEFGRAHNLQIGIHETKESMITATKGLWGEGPYFKYALQSLYCTTPEEELIFEDIYDTYWERKKLTVKSKVTYKNRSNIAKQSKASLVMLGEGSAEEDEENNARNTSGASTDDALRKTDFSNVEQIDNQRLEQLADELWKQMSLRLKRRTKLGKKGRVDIKNTIRKNMGRGGNMFDLIKKKKQIQKYKLVVLLDVSGSMDKYSFYLLRFIFSLRSHFQNVEAFTFSTRLIRITEYLDRKNIQESLAILKYQSDNWSSGTKIGASLKKFNDLFAKRILNGRTLTILLSDGLETGDTELLKQEIEKIKLRTKKLVWLNPLKGMQGYEPIQRGMKVALPSIDHFGAGHNINSLLALESILIDA